MVTLSILLKGITKTTITELEKHHIVIHIEKYFNLKKLITLIFFTISLNSFEVSEDIYSQLSETNLLIKEKRILKARESLDYMLEWFSDELNPLERDLIRYFQGEIYILEDKLSLAISNFTAILNSNLLDIESLESIKFKLAKLHLETGNSRVALQFLDPESTDNETIAMRFIAYKNLNNYSKAYETILTILNSDLQNIDIWQEYIELSIRVNIQPKDISISKLLLNFDKNSDFKGFYKLFKEYNMQYQIALLIEKSFKVNIEVDYEMIDKAIDTYIRLMELNRAEKFILLILKRENILKYRLKLVDIYIEIGEFEESLNILDNIEQNKSLGVIHLYRGQIFFLKGQYFEAREEYFKSLKFYSSRAEGMERLNMIKHFLNKL